MACRNGKNMYVPFEVVARIEDLKSSQKIPTHTDAMRKMAAYAEVGREVDRVARYMDIFGPDFGKNLWKDIRRMPPMNIGGKNRGR